MAWVILAIAILMFAAAFLFGVALGSSLERDDKDAAMGTLAVGAIAQVCGMALLLAAGIMFGGV